MSLPFAAPDAAHRHCLTAVRAADRARFLAGLFAPEGVRRRLFALAAFEIELGRTRLVTSEPMLGRIRLEWWREALREAGGAGAPRAVPVAQALAEALRASGSDAGPLIAMVDAREAELEGDLDIDGYATAAAAVATGFVGVGDPHTLEVVGAIARARLTEDAAARAALVDGARAMARRPDPRALPLVLDAVALARPPAPWRLPLAIWWAAQTGRW
ncbi:MAG: hypothetical protein FJX02_08110 [Alphaproteobacteria bacterium]|nr:hypothetical protein [Alphaproteobacteria bacterium]